MFKSLADVCHVLGQGDFKIAHCGGFHSFFNTLIKGINLVAKLLHHNIRWDTETIGCDPRHVTSFIPTTHKLSFMQDNRPLLVLKPHSLQLE